MIDTATVSLNFIKKEVFTGSDSGMRYRLEKSGDTILATIWPEPYAFNATEDSLKTKESFPLTPEGKDEAVEWLNSQHEVRATLWYSVNRKPLLTIM